MNLCWGFPLGLQAGATGGEFMKEESGAQRSDREQAQGRRGSRGTESRPGQTCSDAALRLPHRQVKAAWWLPECHGSGIVVNGSGNLFKLLSDQEDFYFKMSVGS